MGGGEAQRVACEDVAGPGAGQARQDDGIDAVLAIGGFGDLDEGGVRVGGGWDRSRRTC